jgi:hypothetical protein
MPFEQNDTRRGDVEGQAQQCRDQQDGGKTEKSSGFITLMATSMTITEMAILNVKKRSSRKAAAAGPSSPGSAESAPGRPAAAGQNARRNPAGRQARIAIQQPPGRVPQEPLSGQRRHRIVASLLAPVAQLIDIGQHLGDRRVERRRDLLIEVDVAIERARQGCRLDHRYAMVRRPPDVSSGRSRPAPWPALSVRPCRSCRPGQPRSASGW